MHNENQINVIKNDKVDTIRSSIEDLRNKLFINDLKNDLQELIDINVELDKRNNNHGMIADSKLEPLAKLSNYDNDNLSDKRICIPNNFWSLRCYMFILMARE